MPSSDFIIAMIFAICSACLAAAYPRIDLTYSYQEILRVRDIPFVIYYIPGAIAFWLLQLIAVCFLGRQTHTQSEQAYWSQLGIAFFILAVTGVLIAWKMHFL